jgi:hypothetical protein
VIIKKNILLLCIAASTFSATAEIKTPATSTFQKVEK